jgi:hypothetical protein
MSWLIFGWDDATMARVYTRKAGAEEADREPRNEAGLTTKIVPPPAPPEEMTIKMMRWAEGAASAAPQKAIIFQIVSHGYGRSLTCNGYF